MIVVVGTSHRVAPIEIRERLAIDAEALPQLLADVRSQKGIREAACVSTCNRIEVYAVAEGATEPSLEAAASGVLQVLEGVASKNGAPGVARHLQSRKGTDAVRHLFRVTCSLDSLVLGEPQILGQVKDAFDAARSAGTVGRFLERAMSRALHVAKRVRTETAIGAGQVSVSSVAIELAQQIFGDLRGRAAMLVGAGEMAEAAAKLLVKQGAKLVIVNRSPERAQALAADMGGTTRPWDELAQALAVADVVVTSTSARHAVVTKSMVAGAMKVRRGRSLFFIDIAVPRDVEPQVNELDNVYVYDVDDLSQIVAESMRGRMAEAQRAEEIVAHEAQTFETWTDTLNVTPTIVALRAKTRAALVGEMDKSLSGRLKHLTDADRKAMQVMLDAAVNKLLHTPVTRIKALAGDPRGDELVQALHHLFDLPQPTQGESAPSEADEPSERASEPHDHAAGEPAGR